LSPRQTFLLLAGVLLLSAVFQADARATARNDSVTVTVDGVASIEGGDYAGSRDRAIRAALKSALAFVIKSEGYGAKGGEEEKLLKTADLEAFYSNAHSYVSDYRIIEEGAEGGLYRVVLAATVLKGRVIEELESRVSGAPAWHATAAIRGALGAEPVMVRVSGIRTYAQYGELKQYLAKEIPCISSVYPRSFEYQSVEFEVRLQSNRSIDCLEKRLAVADIPGVPVVLRYSTDEQIELQVLGWPR